MTKRRTTLIAAIGLLGALVLGGCRASQPDPTTRTADVRLAEAQATASQPRDRGSFAVRYEVSAPPTTVLAPSCDSAGRCAFPSRERDVNTHGRCCRHRGGRGFRGYRHRLRELCRKRDRHRHDRAMRLRNLRSPVLHRLRRPRPQRRSTRHVAGRAGPRVRRPRVAHRQRNLHGYAEQPRPVERQHVEWQSPLRMNNAA